MIRDDVNQNSYIIKMYSTVKCHMCNANASDCLAKINLKAGQYCKGNLNNRPDWCPLQELERALDPGVWVDKSSSAISVPCVGDKR